MASRPAVWALLVSLVLVGAAVLIAALELRGIGDAVPGGPLVLDWNVPESLEESSPPWRPFTSGFLGAPRPTVFDVVRTLDRAAHDDRVQALVMHIDGTPWGWAKLSEVRDAVLRFHAEGKRVEAVLESGGDAEYFLATAADRIALPPATTLGVNGLAATATYARGALDKLGIKPQFAYAGEYKSAVEFYTRTDMSAPAREALNAMLDDVFRLYVDSVATARRLRPETVRALIDQGPFTSRDAMRQRLVDTLAHADDMDSTVVRRVGHGADLMSMTRYAQRMPWRVGGRVALIEAAGTIATGRTRIDPVEGLILGEESLTKVLREVRERSSIKAVVLRIDSPGGDAVASDVIWNEVRRLNAQKPVIVSMSDLAASGGYYIAAPATRIIAQPATITGSIGVFGGKFDILGLYHKLGLNVSTVTRGRHAEMLSPFEAWTPEEAQSFQGQIDDEYRLFLHRVAAGRRSNEAAIDRVGRGHIWTGEAARARGLVDGLGGIPMACRLAFKAAGIETDHPLDVEVYPRRERTFLDRFVQGWMGEPDGSGDLLSALPPVVRAWLAAERFPVGQPLTLMPWSIQIR